MARKVGILFLVAFLITVNSQGTDYCATGPCQNGGSCMVSGTYYMCMCPMGYSGFNCETSSTGPTPCDAQPCQNGGTCMIVGTSYACACTNAYSGTNCEIPTSPTANTYCNVNQCQNGGICQTSGTYYQCDCPLGTTGYNCETVTDDCNSNPCNGGVCSVLSTGGYQCISCSAGRYGDRCQNLLAMCSSTTCGVGTCTESGVYYLCDCPPGYTGANCANVEDPCNGNPCENGGICSSSGQPGTTFLCTCSAGFEGTLCEHRSAEYCTIVRPCLNGGSCEISGTWYICNCATGYSGYNCGTLGTNLCNPSPCLNGGACNIVGNTYQCICPAGYSGTNCGSTVGTNPCEAMPCMNGGVCNIVGNTYQCVCPSGYSGTNCETTENAEWSYKGNTGPEFWGLSYPTCGTGQRQSPINIGTMRTPATFPITPIVLSEDWNQERPITIVNNGHTVQATLYGQYQSTGGPLVTTPYLAEQFHFHWGINDAVGSEHTVNGMAYPGEMHVVHYDSSRFGSVSEAVNADRGLAVFGFFIEIGSADNQQFQPIVDAIGSSLEKDATRIVTSFGLGRLVSANINSYWTYPGSLTTPPCSESVVWIVFQTPIQISQTQMNAFRSLGASTYSEPIINNFRPTQSERAVTYQGP